MPAPEPNRCLGCGYILDNLPEPRCPECGRPFDLSDPTTYRSAHILQSDGTRTVWLVVGSWLAVGGLTAGTIVVAEAHISGAGSIGWAIAVPIAGMAAWSCNLGVALRSSLEVQRRRRAGCASGDWALAFLLATVGVIGLSAYLGLIGWLIWGFDPLDGSY